MKEKGIKKNKTALRKKRREKKNKKETIQTEDSIEKTISDFRKKLKVETNEIEPENRLSDNHAKWIDAVLTTEKRKAQYMPEVYKQLNEMGEGLNNTNGEKYASGEKTEQFYR